MVWLTWHRALPIQISKFQKNQSSKPKSAGSARDLAKNLDDFFAEGVQQRNEIQAGHDYSDEEYNNARDCLIKWSDRVVNVLDNDLVSVSDMSKFRTLNQFDLDIDKDEPHKSHIRGMWSEKLKRLRAIIDGMDC